MSIAELTKQISVNLDDNVAYSHSFKWHEALFLRELNIYVYPTNFVYKNIIRIASKLEAIKGRFGNKPIIIKSWYRPSFYNDMVKGSPLSPHISGEAVDFNILTYSCDEVRKGLESELERLQIRCERLPEGSPWVHIDLRPPGPGGRFFTP